MFKQALAIAVIGTAALTSVAASASDWGAGASRYAPPPTVRYVHNGPPVRYITPRYYPAYRWAPAPYRWAPHRHWYPAYGHHRYGYNPGYRYNGRNDWDGRGSDRDWDRNDHRGDDDHRSDRRGR